VFDPERDDDSDGRRRFYRRLLVVVVISAAGCVALWPSVSGFSGGPDHDTGCLAITDGWHADKGPPSDAEINAAYSVMPKTPSRAQMLDPQFMAHWRVAWRAAQADPAVVRVNEQIDWVDGAGVCVRPSRHRLIVSGIGLGALTLVVGGIAIVRRTRTNLRRSAADVAAA
jgi:hypothetical protein